MVVAEVVGVGIFLTPATMLRSSGGLGLALTIWAGMGLLSAAGALCYAELASRFPAAGGGYVFLREAFGARTAFVHGWISALVIDPGLTAALGLGFAQYATPLVGMPVSALPPVAMGSIVVLGLLSARGLRVSALVMNGIAVAKLAAVAAILVATLTLTPHLSDPVAVMAGGPTFDPGTLATSIVAAFFAFGGWWDLGRMAGEVDRPSRTMPVALVGGVALVTLIYMVASIGFTRAAAGRSVAGDEALVATVGANLFGPSGAGILSAIVLVAVCGSLVARLVGSPRLYLAMAHDGLFPRALATFDAQRGAAPRLTLLQVALACAFVAAGTFDEILGYFIPAAVFFLGLSAAAVLRLPRLSAGTGFQAPWHPLPIVVFLVLIVVVLGLFLVGRPVATVGVAALGLVVFGLSRFVMP